MYYLAPYQYFSSLNFVTQFLIQNFITISLFMAKDLKIPLEMWKKLKITRLPN